MPAVKHKFETGAEQDTLERFNAQKTAGVWDSVKRVAMTEIPGTKPWLVGSAQKATRFGQAPTRGAVRGALGGARPRIPPSIKLGPGHYDASGLAAQMGIH